MFLIQFYCLFTIAIINIYAISTYQTDRNKDYGKKR